VQELYSTERLTLRRPEAADAAVIFANYAADPDVTRFLSWPTHENVADSRRFLKLSDAAWATWGAGPLLIAEKESGAVIGSTGVDFETAYRASTGYVLAKDMWGSGYASEALAGVLELLKGTEVWRVEAICHVDHPASEKVLEKAGFELEGTLRRHTIFPNLAPEPQDVKLFSRIMW
jgi:ribosomal-protein-alanine N-acetyltransferase